MKKIKECNRKLRKFFTICKFLAKFSMKLTKKKLVLNKIHYFLYFLLTSQSIILTNS